MEASHPANVWAYPIDAFRCGEIETSYHALSGYHFARKVWRFHFASSLTTIGCCRCTNDWLDHILATELTDKASLFLLTTWAMWNDHNKRVFEGEGSALEGVGILWVTTGLKFVKPNNSPSLARYV